MSQPQKAKLTVHWQAGDRDYELQFNPTEIVFNKGAQLAEIPIPGLDSPLIQFVYGQAETLTLELFFDTTEDGMGDTAVSVTNKTDPIYELVKIEPRRHAPPVCTFIWNTHFPGNDVSDRIGNQRRGSFKGVVESVRQSFTLFSPQGVPLRAKVNLTLREYKTLPEQLQQLGLNSPDRTHSHVVQEGDTLTRIAAEYYRRPGDWRRIALKNSIEDPRRLTPGMFLTIPPIK